MYRWPLTLLICALFGVGCASLRGEEPEEMPSAEDLYQEGVEELSKKKKFLGFDLTDYDTAIERFQEVIDNYPYSDQAVLSELKIADTYFEQEKYEDAVSYYRDFADLHPKHPEVPYTIHQSALCYYRQTKSSTRDQSATRKAIATFEIVMRRYPYSEFAEKSETLWRELQQRLAKHELEIGNYYMKRSEYSSASERFSVVLDTFPGLGFDAEALYKLGLCYAKMNRQGDAERVFELVHTNYPESKFAKLASEQAARATN